jgi:hypothetical protein
MSSHWPNLYVVGAPKCGTTSLHYYLGQHADVFVSQKKELHYFSKDELWRNSNGPGDKYALRTVTMSDVEYLDHFQSARGFQYRVDVSPSYLFYDATSGRIAQKSPEAKIIVMLRNPSQRAYSQYLHLVRDTREVLTFGEALDAEHDRSLQGWSDMWRYVDSSLLAGSVRNYMAVFGSSNVFVIFSEELSTEPTEVLNQLWRFLGLDNVSIRTDITRNKTGAARSRPLASFISRPNALKRASHFVLPEAMRGRLALKLIEANTGGKPDLEPGIAERLDETFREEVSNLRDLVSRPLPWD